MEKELGLSYKEILMDGMQSFVFVIKIGQNFDFYFTFLNRAAMSATGLGDNIIGKNMNEIFEKERADFVYSKFFQVAKSGKALIYEDSFMSPNGRTYYTESKLTPIFRNNSKQCTHIVVSAKDITEERIVKLQHRLSNERLKESENRLRIITEHARDLISLLSRDKRYMYTSPSYQTVLGYNHEDYIGIAFMETIHPDDQDSVEEILNHSIEKRKPCTFQVQKRHRTSGWIWLEVSATPVFNDSNHFIHLVMVARDITLQKEYESKLKHLALHDVLTGLPNRLQFNTRLKDAMEAFHLNREKLAVLMVDIDNFKEINDSFGHDVGDIVIEKFGHLLSTCIRNEDFVARLGGDEFAILLCNIHSKEDAVKVTKRIYEVLDDPIYVDHFPIQISASIGIAIATDRSTNELSILKQADIALYEAKNLGKNIFCVNEYNH